jgi:hypothetical protein
MVVVGAPPFAVPAVVVPVVVVRGRSFSGSVVPTRSLRWLAHIRASKMVLNKRNALRVVRT